MRGGGSGMRGFAESDSGPCDEMPQHSKQMILVGKDTLDPRPLDIYLRSRKSATDCRFRGMGLSKTLHNIPSPENTMFYPAEDSVIQQIA